MVRYATVFSMGECIGGVQRPPGPSYGLACYPGNSTGCVKGPPVPSYDLACHGVLHGWMYRRSAETFCSQIWPGMLQCSPWMGVQEVYKGHLLPVMAWHASLFAMAGCTRSEHGPPVPSYVSSVNGCTGTGLD